MGTIKSKHKKKKTTPKAVRRTDYCEKCNVFYLKFDDNKKYHCCNINAREPTPKETKKDNESSRKPSDNTISFPVRKLSNHTE